MLAWSAENVEECWTGLCRKLGEVLGKGGGHKAKAVRPRLNTTPIEPRASLSTLLLSPPPLPGLVFQGPTSLQDVWCGSLDADFLCIGRGLTAK